MRGRVSPLCFLTTYCCVFLSPTELSANRIPDVTATLGPDSFACTFFRQATSSGKYCSKLIKYSDVIRFKVLHGLKAEGKTSMKTNGKNILITGGAGFIGSHLVDEYIEQRARKVIVFDDFSTGFTKNLESHRSEQLSIVKGSILNAKLLNQTVKREEVEIIDHEAAELEVYTGILNAQEDAKINILGTLNVLNTAVRNKVEKVLFASSGAVYGEADYLPVDENHPLTPHWPYGVSKLSAERYCIQYYRLYGLDTTAFRYSIVYGPREWYGRVLTMFMKRIFLENKPPVVFGNGKQVRDFVYVKDLVKAHVRAVESSGVSGEVFNLSSGKSISINSD